MPSVTGWSGEGEGMRACVRVREWVRVKKVGDGEGVGGKEGEDGGKRKKNYVKRWVGFCEGV